MYGERSLERSLATDVQLQLIREAFGRIVYTHKTHEKERERLTAYGVVAKWVNIVLCGLTFSGIFVTVGTQEVGWLVASLILSALSAGFAVFQVSFEPLKAAEAHRAAAKTFLSLRNRYELLIADIADQTLTDDETLARRDSLASESNEAFALAPDTSSRSYRKAQQALKINEDLTFSDDEINAFLPPALHRQGD